MCAGPGARPPRSQALLRRRRGVALGRADAPPAPQCSVSAASRRARPGRRHALPRWCRPARWRPLHRRPRPHRAPASQLSLAATASPRLPPRRRPCPAWSSAVPCWSASARAALARATGAPRPLRAALPPRRATFATPAAAAAAAAARASRRSGSAGARRRCRRLRRSAQGSRRAWRTSAARSRCRARAAGARRRPQPSPSPRSARRRGRSTWGGVRACPSRHALRRPAPPGSRARAARPP